MSKTRKVRRARHALERTTQHLAVAQAAVERSERRIAELEQLQDDLRSKWDKVAAILVQHLPNANVLRNVAEGVPEIELNWLNVDHLRDIAEYGYQVPSPSSDLTAMDVKTIYPLIVDYAKRHAADELEYVFKLNYGAHRVWHALSPELIERLSVDQLVRYISTDMANCLLKAVRGGE